VIPRQKTLIAYARALARAESTSQVAIICDSYRRQLSNAEEIEVLDLLAAATDRARLSVGEVTTAAATPALPQQLAALRVMRSAAAANGFHLRMRSVEIEIEKG
jgi:hypothetical protein